MLSLSEVIWVILYVCRLCLRWGDSATALMGWSGVWSILALLCEFQNWSRSGFIFMSSIPKNPSGGLIKNVFDLVKGNSF